MLVPHGGCSLRFHANSIVAFFPQSLHTRVLAIQAHITPTIAVNVSHFGSKTAQSPGTGCRKLLPRVSGQDREKHMARVGGEFESFCQDTTVSRLREPLAHTRIKTTKITTTPYSPLRAVTLSGSCGPSCSSPTTTAVSIDGLMLFTSCPLSGRDKSNCLMIVTKNVCNSTTLRIGGRS